MDDAQHEPTRQFRLELSGSGNLYVGPRSNALLVLNDGDFATTPARGVAGVVEAMANAPAGGVYLAGDFSSVHGVPRSRVARLLPDGEVDTSFAPRRGARCRRDGAWPCKRMARCSSRGLLPTWRGHRAPAWHD